jgi:hypothetical protein
MERRYWYGTEIWMKKLCTILKMEMVREGEEEMRKGSRGKEDDLWNASWC